MAKTRNPPYLQKRRRLWYAVHEIPADLRKSFGRARFVASLGTDSQSIAKRRVTEFVAKWKRKIADARGEPVEDDAAWYRRRLRFAKSEEDRQSILEQISAAADDIAYDHIDPGQPLSSVPEAQAFYTKATSHGFLDELEGWLANSRTTARTQAMQRSVCTDFAKSFPLVTDVRRVEVKRWVMARLNDGLSPKTVNRQLSFLRTYWRHLSATGTVREDDASFDRLAVARAATKADNSEARTAFAPGDVVKLLQEATRRGDTQLADLIDLARYTGCRREELCSLRVEDVNLREGHFTVRDAKSKAGNRAVPVHSALSLKIAKLVEGSTDGFVLSGLTATPLGHRSDGIGRRFGALKTAMGFGRQHNLHSIRRTFVSILENAGCAGNVVAAIVGHGIRSLTYGLYSSGPSLEVKWEAMEKLSYPVG